jgi:hypothetical protein
VANKKLDFFLIDAFGGGGGGKNRSEDLSVRPSAGLLGRKVTILIRCSIASPSGTDSQERKGQREERNVARDIQTATAL